MAPTLRVEGHTYADSMQQRRRITHIPAALVCVCPPLLCAALMSTTCTPPSVAPVTLQEEGTTKYNSVYQETAINRDQSPPPNCVHMKAGRASLLAAAVNA
jgi:hypothetical protein